MTNQPVADQREAAQHQRPAAVTALIVATAILVYRAGALGTIGQIGELPDGPPESWFVPMLGDIFVGIAAVVTAILLWRRATFGVWLTAVIYHALAFLDIVQAIVNAVREPWDAGMGSEFIFVGLEFGVLVSVVNVYLLSRRGVRRYYKDNNAL